ncbi:MAG: DNA alkylation repair protein [Bacteroidia bacterium]|nr:DNA alkylation repair protein [Bacteroidia bacterium]
MNTAEVMQWLKDHSSATIKNVLSNHGAPESLMGVKIGDMKTLMKLTGKDHVLALELYRTGISDAQYYAGLIADPKKMDGNELRYWADHASWHMISDYSVAWNAAESTAGQECALEWIDSNSELLLSAGWYTLAYRTQLNIPIDKDLYLSLIGRVRETLQQAPNRARYSMNNFLITTGAADPAFTDACKKAAADIGEVHVDLGKTSCEVPQVVTYIDKAIARGSYTKKKKTVKC